MIRPNRLIIYSIVALVLLGVAVYRSLNSPEPDPPPKVEIDLPREGANPGMLNDNSGPNEQNKDFDGDDPELAGYSFDFDIEPIMTARCFSCHSKEEKVRQNLVFYDYNTVLKQIIPGDLNSTLPKSIAKDGSMRHYLSDEEANLIREWISKGARQ